MPTASFKQDPTFSKGIISAEFFDPATDNLIGFSQYITNFTLNGTVNAGEVEAGPGNLLVMTIPDTARLNITAQTADTSLNTMALPVGGTISGNGIIETVIGVTATGNTLTLNNAVAPYGGRNGAVCYILTSSGADKTTVEANSGTAYTVSGTGTIEGFSAVSGNVYCVKYFVENSSALAMDIPALFAPKVVRAHFAVNLYAKKTGNDVMESSIYAIRHYYIPYYFFTAGLQDSVGQTTTGSTDLSGMALSYEQAIEAGNCADYGKQSYGFIVDEILGTNASTAKVEGIYFVGLGAGISIGIGETRPLPLKYAVSGQLTNISDMSAVTVDSSDAAVATVSGAQITGVEAGTTQVTATVTNSSTGETYSDVVSVTVAAS